MENEERVGWGGSGRTGWPAAARLRRAGLEQGDGKARVREQEHEVEDVRKQGRHHGLVEARDGRHLLDNGGQGPSPALAARAAGGARRCPCARALLCLLLLGSNGGEKALLIELLLLLHECRRGRLALGGREVVEGRAAYNRDKEIGVWGTQRGESGEGAPGRVPSQHEHPLSTCSPRLYLLVPRQPQ